MTEENVACSLGEVKHLNCAPGFWDAFNLRPGIARRKALLAIFQKHPTAKLPVNNKWQANMADPDLHYLMKKGVLCQVRDRSSHAKELTKTSAKRQSYLTLVKRTF